MSVSRQKRSISRRKRIRGDVQVHNCPWNDINASQQNACLLRGGEDASKARREVSSTSVSGSYFVEDDRGLSVAPRFLAFPSSGTAATAASNPSQLLGKAPFARCLAQPFGKLTIAWATRRGVQSIRAEADSRSSCADTPGWRPSVQNTDQKREITSHVQ